MADFPSKEEFVNMTSSNTLPASIELLRKSLLAAYYALLAYFLVSAAMVFGEFRPASLVIWIIQITPLLIFARGLHYANLRTYGWVSFVILLYFMHGVLIAFQPGQFWLGLVEASLSTVIFVLLILFIRQYRVHYQVSL
tara:strand:+ start:449 stop:865 length:417 start_codon:yes stop_codon:yes gene_type:complete